MNYKNLSITEISKMLMSKKISSVELTQHYLKQIHEKNKELNCFITICDDIALNQAKESDKRLSSNTSLSILDGIPFGIKDLFCTKGIKTTSASKMLSNFIPQYESTATQRIWDKGAINLGKTNMDEFAMGSATSRSYFGKCLSPLKLNNVNLMPGGSSGGSASAVSAGMCPAAFGSDTGGSVRQPAAFCGIVGFKPTYGRISRYGMIAYASSFDQCGFLTSNVNDSAILTSFCSGKDGYDSTLTDAPLLDIVNQTKKDLKGIKIGISDDFIMEQMDKEIVKSYYDCIEVLKKLGAEIVKISVPNIKYSLNVYYFISTAEASSNLARYDGVRYGHRTEKKCNSYEEFISLNRAEGFCDEVQNRILIGTQVLLKDNYHENYEKILKLRQMIRNDYDEAFKTADIIFLPTTPNLAPEYNYKFSQIEEYMCDILTVSLNVAGLGGISMPVTNSKDNRPIGMQFFYKPFDEKTLFDVARIFETELSYKHPL